MTNFNTLIKTSLLLLAIGGLLTMTSCGDDDLASTTFDYSFNTGQVAADFAYAGMHSDDLSATMEVKETEDGGSEITFTLKNTMDGMTYNTHAHDMADAATTPNGTPYIESPNSNVFAHAIVGTGGDATHTHSSTMSHDEIVNNYDGFLVVHDPLQALSTTDPTTYVILGVFAR